MTQLDKLTVEEERDIYKAAFEKQTECFNSHLNFLYAHGIVITPIPECVKGWNLLQSNKD